MLKPGFINLYRSEALKQIAMGISDCICLFWQIHLMHSIDVICFVSEFTFVVNGDNIFNDIHLYVQLYYA